MAIYIRTAVNGMRSKNVLYFTQREEEFANLLIRIGEKRNVAKVLG